MPIRMLRDWTTSDKVKVVSVHAERFFVRLIMKADDYGCFHATPSLLKAYLFPLLLDSVREADLTRWMDECHKAGLIVLYESDGKKYLQIVDFKQRLDKSRSKFPLPIIIEKQPVNGSVEVVNDFPAETETETETEKISPTGVGDAIASPQVIPLYSSIEKTKLGIFNYLKLRPKDIEPYRDFWNMFATEKGLATIQTINDERRRKFKVRLGEKAFDFLDVISKASKSEFLKTSSWFGWDWIFENQKNYVKVVEGNYDTKEKSNEQSTGSINEAIKAAKRQQATP